MLCASATAVWRASPSQAAPSDVSVEVTMNGQQYSRSAIRFAYHAAEEVWG